MKRSIALLLTLVILLSLAACAGKSNSDSTTPSTSTETNGTTESTDTADTSSEEVPDAASLDQWTKIVNNGRPVMAVSKNLEDAAKTMGIDPKGLAAQVAHWNDMVKAGADKDFNRRITGGLGEGPYHIVEQKVRYQTTLGGLKADGGMRILDKAGNPIPGLYGAGCVVGGANGADSMTAMMNSWAIVSGVVAAETAAKDLK